MLDMASGTGHVSFGEVVASSLYLTVVGCAGLLLTSSACVTPPSPSAVGCEVAPFTVMDQLQHGLTADGELRHGRVRASGDGWHFVSAELLPAGEAEDFSGRILTWASPLPDSGEFESVDVNAIESSQWPRAAFDVRADGAIESRGCVLPHRGTSIDDYCAPGLEQFC